MGKCGFTKRRKTDGRFLLCKGRISRDFKRGERDGIGTCICGLYKYIGEWKNNKKGKIGTYYLSSKVIIDIVIENDILNGIYKINDEEKYINNIDLNVIEEKDMLENIEKYLNDNINHHNYS